MKSFSVGRSVIFSLALAVFCPSQAREGVFDVATAGGSTVSLDFINPDIVRVTTILPGENPGEATPASVLTPVPFTGNVTEDTSHFFAVTTSAGLRVAVDKTTGSVSLTAGRAGVLDLGERKICPCGKRRLSMMTLGGGSFYGGGERGYSLNLAGDTLVMYNRQNYGYTAGDPRIKQMNITMPVVLSSNGYALVFDDFAPAKLTLSNPLTYTTEGKAPISYYFVNGNGSLEGTVRRLSELTGRQELPPLWSLGYITSKYGYKTQHETDSVVSRLKRGGYPLDGVVLDLYWYGKEQDMGRLSWDPVQWPDHKKMLPGLRKKGVNTVIIHQPYILRNGRALDNYNLLKEGGMMVMDSVLSEPQEVKIWVGEGGMFDVSNPSTREWMASRLKELTDEGVGGWWGDLGEPEVHPENGRHANGLTARQYHNLYGNDWSSIIYELYKKEYPDTRLMTMMRGGTTGLQRYSVFPWSTDVSRSWGGLQPQVTIMLNSGLSGLGYMSHDVGGFAVDPAAPYDPELYVRWLQLGTFSPVLRTHAQDFAEPYLYPDQEDILKSFIRKRYSWLPYNYTLAYDNASLGLPLVRPLNFYAHSTGADVDDVADQYLWGRDVMIAPVLEKGATGRRVVIPDDGSRWIDYNDPSKIFAPGSVIENYEASLSVLPMFVREGAFIPEAVQTMGSTADYDPSKLTVNYYPVEGATSAYTLFDDDRKSPRSLADAAYQLITFKGDDKKNSIVIEVSSEGSYKGMPGRRELTFAVHGVGKPSGIVVDGRKLKKFSYSDGLLTVPATLVAGRPLTIEILK